jgi:uncharacterized membrane protein (UPF0127 family)
MAGTIRTNPFLITLLAILALVLSTPSRTYGAEGTVSFYEEQNRLSCRYHVELARTPQEQENGLMYRTKLPSDRGMLFIYRDDKPKYFWMKNTLIPLDMIYISRKLIVTEVYRNARPMDETIISSTMGARYVLELNAGEAERCAIRPGTRVRFQGVSR